MNPPEHSVLNVPFRRLRPGTKVPDRAYTGDAGYDLAAAEGVVLAPGDRAVIRTGLAIAVPEGYAGLVLPRSGLAVRYGISLVNAPGLIDSGYRGELMVPLINHDHEESFEVVAGMRIAQLVLVRAAEVRFVSVELFEEGADGRGEGGFGSSGTG